MQVFQVLLCSTLTANNTDSCQVPLCWWVRWDVRSIVQLGRLRLPPRSPSYENTWWLRIQVPALLTPGWSHPWSQWPVWVLDCPHLVVVDMWEPPGCSNCTSLRGTQGGSPRYRQEFPSRLPCPSLLLSWMPQTVTFHLARQQKQEVFPELFSNWLWKTLWCTRKETQSKGQRGDVHHTWV
jgi:hypothetical protein